MGKPVVTLCQAFFSVRELSAPPPPPIRWGPKVGRAGPPPAPTALRVLRGDPASRLNRYEPLPPLAEATAPEWLAPDALELWGRLAPSLEDAGLLSVWDVELFASYCDAATRHREAGRQLDAGGSVIMVDARDRHGRVTGTRSTMSPWFLVWRVTGDVASRLGSRFGLSPSDRSSLRIQPAPPARSTDRF